jgi:hypothetical protein
MLGPVRVEQGGEGDALTVAGEVLHIVIDRPYAPGAPISMTITRADGALGLRGKTIGSKRRDDGRFDVRLRLVSLSRTDRARLST